MVNVQRKTKNKSFKHKKLALLLAIVLLSGAAYALIVLKNHNTAVTGKVNYGPPTAQEKKAGDTVKDDVIARQKQEQEAQQQSEDNASANKKASVIITDANQYDNTVEVRAFIPDYYQNGTCTITFKKDSYTVAKTTPAYKDATTTICTNPLISRTEFATAGTWQLTVAYTAQGASGQSEVKNVMIK